MPRTGISLHFPHALGCSSAECRKCVYVTMVIRTATARKRPSRHISAPLLCLMTVLTVLDKPTSALTIVARIVINWV